MDHKKLAEEIIEKVGGASNIISITNCITRLRFVLKDEKLTQTAQLKETKGVLGVAIQGGQYQVIIGNEVANVCAAAKEILGISEDMPTQIDQEGGKKDTLFNRFFKTISGCVFPTLGVMIAAGIIKGFLSVLTSTGVLTADSGTYMVLYAASDVLLYFFPIVIGFSAGKVFQCNPYVTALIGGSLVYPTMISAYNAGTALTFLGIPIALTSYTNSIFPIIVASWAASKVEKFAKKIIPNILQLMFVPCFVIIIMVPLTFLAIGPVMNLVSGALATATMAIFNTSPLFAGLLLGAFWQVIVIFGLHYAFIPVLISNFTTMGSDPVNAVLGVTVFALCGSAFGYVLKVKDKEKKALGVSSLVSGLLGVTEPIIYSIALPLKKPFVCAFVGGGIAGAITAVLGARTYGFGGAGLLAGPVMINPAGIDSSFTTWLIASSVAFVISAILCFLFGTNKEGK
ncbi:PTS transporter subunit EIIC [Candidatus Galacturonibacter soehngenii]|uniref:PTS beta-glucoside EIIBCA subunit BglP n=1 Tax=Candidatus Galacturonatibacter soehngenii TaxID=2307010 RepID=A0A7V7QP05_9FIRM|nr:PTS transporter subunit EIIC [Candidatus Galacturonibacter soehngenii]KAB1441035.1 PTS beta-glucoside EIIBCA subunit BglP [Candidatus Galacturonibacter soehngenii]